MVISVFTSVAGGAQWIKACTVSPEELSSVPITHEEWLETAPAPAPGDLISSSASTCNQTNIHIQINKNK